MFNYVYQRTLLSCAINESHFLQHGEIQRLELSNEIYREPTRIREEENDGLIV